MRQGFAHSRFARTHHADQNNRFVQFPNHLS
jgi:hypothetical protein